jgi:hypothetical protein
VNATGTRPSPVPRPQSVAGDFGETPAEFWLEIEGRRFGPMSWRLARERGWRLREAGVPRRDICIRVARDRRVP